MINSNEELEDIIKILKKHKIKEFSMDDLKIVFFDEIHEPELTEEQKEMLDKLENDTTSDEDILMNPYAGME